jgi:hypothetical protein
MRRILNQAGAADPEGGGLRRALTICRSHFKTFTPGAPLFGKHTGQYWWAPHVRGNPDVGIVVNDYRVHAPGGGRRRLPAGQRDRARRTAPGPSGGRPRRLRGGMMGRAQHDAEPDGTDRRSPGMAPRSPRGAEPRFDLAWVCGQAVWVAEVKSITRTNEERQLRTAIGQVLRYRQKLTAGGHDVQAVIIIIIITSRQPDDPQLGRAVPVGRDHPALARRRRRTAARRRASGLTGRRSGTGSPGRR